MKIYQVGGSVRDKLLNLETKDYDYAVEAGSFEEMKSELERLGYKIFLEKPEFLTIRARNPNTRITSDFTICRTDGFYSDARRPDQVHIGSLMDDLARRDYTCNAIAIDPDTQEYIDPHNGLQDIKDGILRAVGNPSERIKEDALRIIRGLRMILMKDLKPDPELEKAFNDPDLGKILEKISVERKRDELHRMFQYDTIKTLKLLNKYSNLYPYIFTDELWLIPSNKKK